MTSKPATAVFAKETLIDGQPAQITCVDIHGQTFEIRRGVLTTIKLEDEWFEEVRDPQAAVDTLQNDDRFGADVFTFCQRLPHVVPRFPHAYELESIAAIEIDSYSRWWGKQIEGATRNQIRKSQKLGVEVRLCEFDDDFVRGMTAVFNETPVRQGRRFWHYGKDFETIKRQFSRSLFREELIGAFHQGELIGFAMVGKSRAFNDLGQIITKIEHREKCVTSALIAKAVELSCALQTPYLVYAFWTEDSLGQFKRRLGFREVKLPRYFVPLTAKGRLAMRTGAHRGLKQLLPAPVTSSLKRARSTFYEWQERRRLGAGR
jgi:hypothetical protein